MTVTRVTIVEFRRQIEEAVSMVGRMGPEDKLKAVQYWNAVSEKLQEIVNDSAADISALAMEMDKDKREYLGLNATAAAAAAAAEQLQQQQQANQMNNDAAAQIDTMIVYQQQQQQQQQNMLTSASVESTHNQPVLLQQQHDASLSLNNNNLGNGSTSMHLVPQYNSFVTSLPSDSNLLQYQCSVGSLAGQDQLNVVNSNAALAAFQQQYAQQQLNTSGVTESSHHLLNASTVETLFGYPLHPTSLSSLETDQHQQQPIISTCSSLSLSAANLISAAPVITSSSHQHHLGLGDIANLPSVSSDEFSANFLNNHNTHQANHGGNGGISVGEATSGCGVPALETVVLDSMVSLSSHDYSDAFGTLDGDATTAVDDYPGVVSAAGGVDMDEESAVLNTIVLSDVAREEDPFAGAILVTDARQLGIDGSLGVHVTMATTSDGAEHLSPRARNKRRTNIVGDVSSAPDDGLDFPSNLDLMTDNDDAADDGDAAPQSDNATGKETPATVQPLYEKEGDVFRCKRCNVTFSSVTNVKTHILVHTGQRPFSCQECSSTFHTKGNLMRHMRTHTGEKPFSCENCSARFSEKKTLQLHMRKHTGEKPYECKYCLKTFSVLFVLKNHLSTHTGRKPYLCDFCGDKFRQRSQMHLHMMRHEGVKRYECETCKSSFVAKGDYDRHIRMHTGVKPFACEVCNQSFSRRDGLVVHLRSHTGEKPFVCKHCPQMFNNKPGLNRHLRTHAKRSQANRGGKKTAKKASSSAIIAKVELNDANADVKQPLVFAASAADGDRMEMIVGLHEEIVSSDRTSAASRNRLKADDVVISIGDDGVTYSDRLTHPPPAASTSNAESNGGASTSPPVVHTARKRTSYGRPPPKTEPPADVKPEKKYASFKTTDTVRPAKHRRRAQQEADRLVAPVAKTIKTET